MGKQSRRRPLPESYKTRTYRWLAERSELVSTYVKVKETDLHILAELDVSKVATELAVQFRLQVENYIAAHEMFASSLLPLPVDSVAPPMIREMMMAGQAAAVGPMAAVAGAIAHYVGKGLVDAGCCEVIVENGGDIYLHRSEHCTVAVFAGESPLSNRVGLSIAADQMPIGVCTSSGTVGHSLSMGCADSVTVLAESTVLADAAATRLGNEVGRNRDAQEGVSRALAAAKTISGIRGVLVICDEHLGASGMVELIPLG